MTYQKREEIFSKECLDIKDFEELFGVAYSTACEIIRKIKKHLGKDRLNMQGKLHIQDYIEWLDLNEGRYFERYTKPKAEETRSATLDLFEKKEEKNTSLLSGFGYEYTNDAECM